MGAIEADEGQDWINLRETCRILDTDHKYLKKLVAGGYLTVRQLPDGGRKKYLRHEVEQLARACTREATARELYGGAP
jgi:hypothetical protein